MNLKQKLTSRKLWMAVVGVAVGLAAAFGIEENDYAQIAGVVTSVVSVVSYIFGEAAVDAAAAKVPEALPLIEEYKEENTENAEV